MTTNNDIEHAVRERLRTRGPMTHIDMVRAGCEMTNCLPVEVVRVLDAMLLSRAIQYAPYTRRYSLI